MLTVVLTILLAPHVERAVVVGVLVAVAAHLWREMRLGIASWVVDNTLHVALRGVLYFASAPSLEDALPRLLSKHPEVKRVTVHLGGLGRIDVTGALALGRMLEDWREAGLEPEVTDVPPHGRKIVARVLSSPIDGAPAIQAPRSDGARQRSGARTAETGTGSDGEF